MPLDGLVEAIRHHAVPENKNWFAYTVHNQAAAEAVAASLAPRTGLPFEPDDVRFAPGTFGALSAASCARSWTTATRSSSSRRPGSSTSR